MQHTNIKSLVLACQLNKKGTHLEFSVALGVLQQLEEELRTLLWPTTLGRLVSLGLTKENKTHQLNFPNKATFTTDTFKHTESVESCVESIHDHSIKLEDHNKRMNLSESIHWVNLHSPRAACEHQSWTHHHFLLWTEYATTRIQCYSIILPTKHMESS